MRKIKYLCMIVIVISFDTATGQQWQKINVDSFVLNLSGLFFASAETGFMLGCDPTQSSWSTNVLYVTTDSGNTWKNSIGSELCMPLVYFVNKNTGFSITRGSAVGAEALKKTKDGGKTWTTLNIQFSNFDRKGMFFVDENTGYYGGGDGFYIYKTIDGGATWTIQSTGANNAVIDDIYFLNKDTGIIAGWYGSKISKTVNGGLTWYDVSNKYAVYDFNFPSPTIGYAVGSDLSNNPVVIKSSDSGNNWSTVYLHSNAGPNHPDFFSSVFCTDINTCYVVGDSGIVLKTEDGGNTWLRQISGTNVRLNSIFCTASTCFAAGDEASLFKTENNSPTGGIFAEASESGLTVYPNPVSDILTLDFQQIQTARIKVLNVFGETVLSEHISNSNGIKMDMRSLKNGLYFIHLNLSNKILINKIIKL